MATVSITVPTAIVARLTAAGRATFPQYSDQTDVQLFKTVTADYWKKILAEYEQKVAQQNYITAHFTDIAAAHDQALIDAAGIV